MRTHVRNCEHKWEEDTRRRTARAQTEGFRLVDALQHLWDTVPGLYQAGLSKDTVARMFVAPRGTHVDARVAHKRNNCNASTCDHNSH